MESPVLMKEDEDVLSRFDKNQVPAIFVGLFSAVITHLFIC
jgi:hypothetical protein